MDDKFGVMTSTKDNIRVVIAEGKISELESIKSRLKDIEVSVIGVNKEEYQKCKKDIIALNKLLDSKV